MPESNKSILENANAAITKGDYESFLSFCSENTTWTFVGDKRLTGKQAVREWMAMAYKEPPNFKVSNLVAEDDFVIALGTITLKNEDDKMITYSYCDVWRFKTGKMVELNAFVIEPKPVA